MDRVVLVTKPTRLEELVQEHLTEGRASFVLSSNGESITPYKEEDRRYKHALSQIRGQVPNELQVTSVSRNDLASFLFREGDAIIACGPDGLLVNLAQFINKQPVIGVNPDHRTVLGTLMRFDPKDVGPLLGSIKSGQPRFEELPFVKAALPDGRAVWGVNDIFIGRRDRISARYKMRYGTECEDQSSDGVLVSTGVGASGWLRSVIAMVDGLTGNRGGHRLTNLPGRTDQELVFVALNPFPSTVTGARLVTGRITPARPLLLTSTMASGGAIFSDGNVDEAISWPIGSTVTLSIGERTIRCLAR